MYYSVDLIYDISDNYKYNDFDKPYLFKGGCLDMEIFKKRNKLKFIKKKLKNVKFDVELYENKRNMGETKVKKTKNSRFSKIYRRIIQDTPPYNYLAEVDLLEYDINDCLMDKFHMKMDNYKEEEGNLLFFGKNARSGCHYHSHEDYILNQVVGKKIVYMFDYYDNKVEMHGLFSGRANFTKDNFFDMDLSNMKVYKVELEEGDSLFIPPWWYHAVEGVGLNLSITKVYPRNNYNYLFDKPYMLLLVILSIITDNMEYVLLYILLILAIMILIYFK
jgi:hypothetical protein